jgi:hypothetical protein
MQEIMIWIAAILLALSALGLLIALDWRASLILLAGVYIGVFLLALIHLPLGMAAVKLVVGWMSASILGMSMTNSLAPRPAPTSGWSQGWLFRLFAGGIMLAFTASVADLAREWVVSIAFGESWGAFLLIGLSLLHLGMSNQPARVSIALLTLLAGFEILYAQVDNSTLVAVLLAGINLGLALAGSYFIQLQKENA